MPSHFTKGLVLDLIEDSPSYAPAPLRPRLAGGAPGLLLTVEMALEVAGDAKATAADKVLPLTLLWDLLEYTPLERCPAPAPPPTAPTWPGQKAACCVVHSTLIRFRLICGGAIPSSSTTSGPPKIFAWMTEHRNRASLGGVHCG